MRGTITISCRGCSCTIKIKHYFNIRCSIQNISSLLHKNNRTFNSLIKFIKLITIHS